MKISTDVFIHLDEGNDKSDLIAMYWEILNPKQQRALINEVKKINAK